MEEKKKNVKHLDDEYRINYILNRGYFNNISKWKGSTKDGRSVQIYLRFSKLSGRLNDRYVDLSQLLLPCKHPHILQHLNAFVDDVIIDDTVYLSFAVMEYLPDYDLFMEIQQRSEAAFVYSEQVASYYMQQILNAFAYLASKHICHCDLKPRSIKVATMESLMRHGSEGNMMPTIKVTELENARVILPNEFAQKHIRVALTPAMPPTDFQLLAPEIVELHRYNGYNCASDIWSAGCLLYSMLSGKRCSFSTISLRDLLLPSMNVDLSERIWLTVSTSAKNLLQRMLTHNPSERISAETALKHPWIRDKNRHGNNRHLHRCIGNMKKFNQRRLRLHNVITISTTNFFLHSLPLINVEERLNNSNWNSNEKISNESNVNESTSVNSDEFKSDEWDMEETVRSTAKYEFLPTKCKIILCKYMKTILRSMEFGELMTDLALPPIQSRDGRHEQIVEERLNYLDKIYNDSTTQKILLILDKIWRKRNVEQEEICDDQMSGHLIDVGVFRDVLLKYIPSTNTSIDENYHIGKGIDVNEKEQTEKDEEEVKELDEEEQQKQSTIQLCDEMKKMKCNRSNSNSKMEMLNGEHLMALLECYVYIVGSKCQSTLTNNIRNAKNNIQQEQALIKLTKRQLLLDENDETSFSQMSNFDKLKAFIRNHENIVCRNDENDDRLVNRMAKLQMPERNRSDTISKKKSPKVLKQTDVNEKFRIHVKNYRMVCFERPNNEPLGITLQSDGNRCMIKRIIYGGFIHRIGNLHVGDEIHEINGRLISQMSTNSIRNYLALQEGIIRLKIITTSKTAAPPCDIYVKCLFNYDSTSDTIHPMNHQTNLEKKKQNISTKFLIGDIFQIISKDDSSFWQARKVHLEQSLCEGTFNGNFYFHSDAPELIPSPELQEMRITHIKTDENHQNKINQKSSYSCLPFPSSSSVSSSSSISSSATTTTTTTITTTITNSTNVVENVETKEKNQMTKGNDSDTSTPKNFSPKSRRSTLTNVDQFNVLTYEEVMLMPKFGRHSIILIGKETIDKKRIIEELLKLDGQFAYPISHTSRLPKNDEHDGKDYYFITWDEMMADIENNEFLEYGIHENAYYGRRLSTITDLIKNNRIALIDIDIKTFRPLRRGEFAPFVVFIRNDMSSGKEQLENESFMNSYSYLFDAIVSYSISSSPTLSPSSSPPTSNILTNRPTISVKSRTGVSSAVFDNYESTVYDNDGMFNEIANQIEKLFVLFTSTPQWIPVSWVY